MKKLEVKNVAVISFDIFDTLITRTVWTPFGIFLLMQKRLADKKYDNKISEYVRNNFALLRKNAEEYARRAFEHIGKEEAALAEIYAVFSQMAYIPDKLLEEIKELEIQTEIENSVPVLANIECLKSYLSRDEQVILISDMYLSKEVIKELLHKVDPILAELPLYISCEYGKTKKNGSLYAYIKEELGVCYSNWTHYGDNERSDVRVPEMLGMKAVPVKLAEGMKGHYMPEDENIYKDLKKQIFLGTARNVIENHSLKNAEVVGAAAGGILLYPYVFWIINSSIERGYTRLYFIARDGFILKKIADEIISAYHYNIKTYYLYGSRKAWRVEDEDSQTLLSEYLQQELVPLDENFALVDLQGTGKSMEYIARQIRKSVDITLCVFYYQMFSSMPVNGCSFMPFCSLGELKFLEPFSRAPHGAVLGYEKRNGRIEPCLEKSDRTLWEESGLLDYIRGVELFSKEITLILQREGVSGASQSIALWMVHYLQSSPDKRVLEFIGDMPHNDTTDDKSSSFAPALSKVDICKLYLWRTAEPLEVYYRGNYLPFSIKRMSEREKHWKQFCERHAYDFWGNGLHKLKCCTKKKRNIPIYKKIVIYAAGQEGKRLFHYITYETRSRVVGWTDINYQELQKKGIPVDSLEKALGCKYDGVVVAIRKDAICEIVKELLVTKGVDGHKIMSMTEFGDFLVKNRIFV